jgi:ribosomal protein L40E
MAGYQLDFEVLRLGLLAAGGAFLALFLGYLLLRGFNCWYWKVNQGLALLVEIRDLLARAEHRALAEREALAAAARRPKETVCRQCGAHYPGELGGQFCEKCGSRL